MKIYVSLSKRNKKLLKYAILFILASILIYYSNITMLDVHASNLETDPPLYNVMNCTSSNSCTSLTDWVYVTNDTNAGFNYIARTNSWVFGQYGYAFQFMYPFQPNHEYMVYIYFGVPDNVGYFSAYSNVSTKVSLCSGYSFCNDTSTVSLGSIYQTRSPVSFSGGNWSHLNVSRISFTSNSTNNIFTYVFNRNGAATLPSQNFSILGYEVYDITQNTITTDLSSIINNQTNTLQNSLANSQTIITNTIEEQNEQTRDTITSTDTSGADEEASGFFNDFENNDFGLSDIITLPLTTIESITSKSCTPLNLTLPFVNKTFQLPCMTTIYSKFEPFYSLYQTITFGVISYWVCVQIYALVKGFKDPTKDEIEVMDL